MNRPCSEAILGAWVASGFVTHQISWTLLHFESGQGSLEVGALTPRSAPEPCRAAKPDMKRPMALALAAQHSLGRCKTTRSVAMRHAARAKLQSMVLESSESSETARMALAGLGSTGL